MLLESEKNIIGKLIKLKNLNLSEKILYRPANNTLIMAERFPDDFVFLVIGTVQDIFKPITPDIRLDAYYEERNNFVVLYQNKKRCFGNNLIGDKFCKHFYLME